MIVVALDTCFNACSVAIGTAGSTVWGERCLMRQGHAEALLPMIEHVMARARIDWGDIDRIAVTHGPGTFTGVRTGLAAARALALARAIPAIGFSSLRAIPAAEGTLVAIDAGRGRLFVQAIGTGRVEITPPQLLSVAEAASRQTSCGLPVLGSGVALLHAAGFAIPEQALADPSDAEPDAAQLIELAVAAPLPEGPPRPLYLREPDAKPQQADLIARLS